jgi:ABC-type Fe3+ transport system permease subunit
MLVIRWLRFLARVFLGLALLLPVVALPLAVLVDRGPAGETRVSPHLFPLVLWLFDDFARTCARNSIIFATIVSLLSVGVGGVLGWVIARQRFWGRALLRGVVISALAVQPAFLALGLDGLGGSLRSLSDVNVQHEGMSLESWRGLPLWIEWIWSTLPWCVALVMVVTAAAVEQLEPSWEDAARLTGVGRFRAWRTLSWPLVRPSAVRAAAIAFVFALVEPGAPLILGLRRTLPFQVIDAASRSEPFPQAAVWALMTGLIALAGWMIWRWLGGTPIVAYRTEMITRSQAPRPSRVASPLGAFAFTIVLAGWAFFGWLPVAGLARLAFGGSRALSPDSSGTLRAILDQVQRLYQPPVPTILFNSLLLGIEVACATIALGTLRAGAQRLTSSNNIVARVARRIALMPPLVQGLGFLAIPWLAGLASTSLADAGQLLWLAIALGQIATELDGFRNPWMMLSICVALSLAPRFLVLWHWQRARAGSGSEFHSARDAARLLGVSRARAARLAQASLRGRWLAGGFLAESLAATNLVPALFFAPWLDGRTIAPAIVELAGGSANARSQAAALALCAIASNLAALALAWLSSALPRAPDLQ